MGLGSALGSWQLFEKDGCGGLQQSERTQVAVPGGLGGNRLKHWRLSEPAWIIDAAAERPPRRTGSSQHPSVAPGGMMAPSTATAPLFAGPALPDRHRRRPHRRHVLIRRRQPLPATSRIEDSHRFEQVRYPDAGIQ